MDMTWEYNTLEMDAQLLSPPSMLDQSVPALTGDGRLMLGTAPGVTIPPKHNARAAFVETHADTHPSGHPDTKHTTYASITYNEVINDESIEEIMSEYFTSTPPQDDDYCASSQSSNDARTAFLSDGQHEPIAWLERSAAIDVGPVITVDMHAEVTIESIVDEIREEARELESASPPSHMDESSRCASVDSLDAFIQDYARSKRASFDEDDDDYSVILPPKRKYTKRANRPLTLHEKRERKKQQNVEAARRYRLKKNAEKYGAAKMLHDLQKRQSALRATIKTTEDEIDIMKKLLHDVRSQMY